MTARNSGRLDKVSDRLAPTRPPDVHVVSLDPTELAEFIETRAAGAIVVNVAGVNLARMV